MARDGTAADLTYSDRTLADITVRDDQKQVEAYLGAPSECGAVKDGAICQYRSDALTGTVTYRDGKVWGVAIVQRGRTPRGVAIGDTAGRVRRLYGAPGNDAATSWVYHSQAEGVDLTFTMQDGRVSGIAVERLIG